MPSVFAVNKAFFWKKIKKTVNVSNTMLEIPKIEKSEVSIKKPPNHAEKMAPYIFLVSSKYRVKTKKTLNPHINLFIKAI